MEKDDLKIGDIVMLASELTKTNALCMTVIAIENDFATCTWYDNQSGNYLEKDFLIVTLVRG